MDCKQSLLIWYVASTTAIFTLRLRLFFSHSKKLRLLGGASYTTGCEACGQEKTIE